jgi:hypothetical protein
MARTIEARKIIIGLYIVLIIGTVLSLLYWSYRQEPQEPEDPCIECEKLLHCEAELDECIAAGRGSSPAAN